MRLHAPGVIAVVSAAVVILGVALIPPQRPAVDFRDKRAVDAAQPVQALTDGAHRIVRWSELVPDGWDPRQPLRDLPQGLSGLSDADPKAATLMARIREAWRKAPANAQLDGATIRIPGYVVPLGGTRELSEFLLVPYFGACIHTPPPPSNQIIHVNLARPIGGMRAMDAVWVSGVLLVKHNESSEGASSYAMTGAAVEHYAGSDRLGPPAVALPEK